ncbi:MAG: glycosyltransferase family 2 protein [Eggerthia catenaformis]|uniref:glycosyltransferase family 2 protein n=1 Tax=Eggerthia catenaformis TaxID=31973 RepID=UPI003FA0573C
MEISVVIPVYGCRAALFELHKRLVSSLSTITDGFEIILVDDNCPQNSWEDIETICHRDHRVVGIHLSRNFGQIKAITAGLDHAKGEWVVVMDCDLQDRPEAIIDLYDKAQEGFDVVFGRRIDRKDTAITKFLSRSFYKVYDYFTEGNFDSTICNFSISKRKVINYYIQMREQNRAYTLFIKWLGFKQAAIDLQADERFAGKSSYNLKRKLTMAFEFITSQSNKPLRFSIKTGFMMALVSFVYILYLIIKASLGGVITGWTTIVASIYLMGGLLLVSIGIMGIYVGNIFNETKNRPLYAISEILNEERREK